MLLWLFGDAKAIRVYNYNSTRVSGFLELERARVHWFLSVNSSDLPFNPGPGEKSTYRSITVDGKEIEFTGGFTDLHTRIYEEILAGRGFGIEDARPSIELVHRIRTAEVVKADEMAHPYLQSK